MAISIYNRTFVNAGKYVICTAKIDMNGSTTGTWIPYAGKLLSYGYKIDSGTGGGIDTWDASEVSLGDTTGWTNDEVLSVIAVCGQNYAQPALPQVTY